MAQGGGTGLLGGVVDVVVQRVQRLGFRKEGTLGKGGETNFQN